LKQAEVQFLADRAAKQERDKSAQADASITVARMQVEQQQQQTTLHHQFHVQQATFQHQLHQQQMAFQQMQFQFQMQMKTTEMYMQSLASNAKCRSEFMVAGLNSKLDLEQLQATSIALFPAPPQPLLTNLPPFDNQQ
jgi:hypothetical protein